MIKEYKEEILRNLGVYELRELARNIGVSSPTTKKRKQLEQEILKISKGEVVPTGKQTNKGRPPKSIKKVENVLDIFVPKELLELTLNKQIDEKLEDLIRFGSNSLNDTDNYQLKGFLRKTNSGYYYFKTYNIVEECVSVPALFVEKYNLMEGDKLEGLAKKSPTDSFYALSQVLTVNGKQPLENRELELEDEIVLSDKVLKGLADIKEGENVLFTTENLKGGIESLKEKLLQIDKSYKVVVLAPSISTYTKLFLEKDFNIELIYTLVEDHPAYVYEASINAINHVNMLIKEGNKVVMVLVDIFSVVNEIETFFALENQKKSHQEHIEAIRIAKKLLNFGKVFASGSSVTVLAHCLENEANNVVYQGELVKLADKVIKL